MRTSQVMSSIPDDAALIFEFDNDKSFYDIFNNNPLFEAIAGKEKIGELDTLRQQLLQSPLLNQYFAGQNLFISLHHTKTNTIDLMLTATAAKDFEHLVFDHLNGTHSGLVITPLRGPGKPGYCIYINQLKKRFYLINSGNNVFSGSFSKELAGEIATYKNTKEKQAFVLVSEKQSANSLANLYVNYKQLSLLLDKLFVNKNTDLFKSLGQLPGLGTLNLNYRSDALMFNGETTVPAKNATGYLSIFSSQRPVVNQLKDIFPSTTAYGTNFSVSDILKFSDDLEQWHIKAGFKNDRDSLFDKIKTETGTDLETEFYNLMGNEFAITTTRYFEKFGIVSVKDGSKAALLLTGISKMSDENNGQLNYDKIPLFLLGDAFSLFKRPYFMIIDNYLIFANSTSELKSFGDIYLNRKFLSKNSQYHEFDNLLAERSNVAFFYYFKNLLPILKRDMNPEIYDIFQNRQPGWLNYYGASWQFTAARPNFYTNFCMRLANDTTTVDKN